MSESVIDRNCQEGKSKRGFIHIKGRLEGKCFIFVLTLFYLSQALFYL